MNLRQTHTHTCANYFIFNRFYYGIAFTLYSIRKKSNSSDNGQRIHEHKLPCISHINRSRLLRSQSSNSIVNKLRFKYIYIHFHSCAYISYLLISIKIRHIFQMDVIHFCRQRNLKCPLITKSLKMSTNIIQLFIYMSIGATGHLDNASGDWMYQPWIHFHICRK